MSSLTPSMRMRIIHRYLGFFLAGIMAVYSISGIVMVFRNTDFLKSEVIIDKQIAPNLKGSDLSPLLGKKIRVEKEEGDIIYYKGGTYNKKTGAVYSKSMELPFVLNKMQKLHKATTDSPLYFLNIFFGFALLFFVISAFWMYAPKMPIFKKGMYFALAGAILTIIMLFL